MEFETFFQRQHCASTGGRMRVAVLLIVVFLSLSSCNNPSTRKSTPPPGRNVATEQLWQQARTAWLLDDVAAAQVSFSRFAEQNPLDPRSGEALLSAGICAQRRGRKEEADGLLREAQSRGGAVSARALLQRGYLVSADQPRLAIPRFAEAARLATEMETRAEAWLQHGISLQRSGLFQEAIEPLQRCSDQAVAPGLSARARLQLQYDPWFTVQVGAFLEHSYAMSQLQQLEQAGLPAEVRSPGRKGSPLYRVLSGRFDHRDEAHRHSLRVRALLGKDDARVIP